MPLVSSDYRAPFWLRGGHCQTIFPSLFRKVDGPAVQRSILATPDQDIIALDLHQAAGNTRSRCAVILSHGLEGHATRKYMRGMMLRFAREGWDSIGRNFRGCGGIMNLTPGMYHSGQTDDIHSVVEHCLDIGYERLALVGFSMGGNQVLKYLGENPDRVPQAVVAAAVFSVPCNLPGAARELDKAHNAIYMRYFLRTLREKVRRKHALYPDIYKVQGLEGIRTFAEFDERYTAPVHGFSSALDYWTRAACLPHLPGIRVPSLLVNARNDPFLSPECSPEALAGRHPALFLEQPAEGGHVGFTSKLGTVAYWSEDRAAAFLSQFLGSA